MRKLTLAVTLLLTTLLSFAQDKHALLIAIDKYTPPPGTKIAGNARSLFRDLDGCLNDARSIHSIVTNRYAFPVANVDTLYNEKATRDGILNSMQKLLKASKPNDVAFIYYAGHGSQVTNSLAPDDEGDKKDESMVPSNTWQPNVKDIRDKELAAVFNEFIDKGVKLTVIFDCCHSGSLSRGPGDPGRFRFIADPNYDAKDATVPRDPETRPEGNFLIMSAAQDNEFAQEQRDENNMPHGAFTLAFIQALNQQSVDASALNLFTSIRAILKSNGRKQEPVIGGKPERQSQTLFGLSKGSVPDKYRVAISGIQGDKVTLQGGYALGLYSENELVKFRGKDTLVKVRIDTVVGINKSIATVIKGSAKDLQAGEYLDVTNWVSTGAPKLKLYIPAGVSSYEQLAKLVKLNNELKQSTKTVWVNDLEQTDPYASIFMKDNKFYINIDDGKGARELKDLNAKAITDMLPKDSTLYFELPPSKEIADAIREKLSSNRNLQIVNNADDANYVLYGINSENGKASYGLRRSQATSKDSLETMPLRTDNFIIENADKASIQLVADSLYEYAMRLFKVRGWLQLAGPRTEKNSFPFHLELVNNTLKRTVGPEGSRVGDDVSLHIKADSVVYAADFNPASVAQKYVYVFALDKMGKMTLIYPDKNDGNKHNKLPNGTEIVKDINLVDLVVEEPVGTDNIFMLATDEPLTTYALLFEQDGVRGIKMRDRGESNPLGDFLNIGNEKVQTRNYKPKTPSNWVLYRMMVKTRR